MTTSELITQYKKLLQSQYDPKEQALSMLLEKYAGEIALDEPDEGWTHENAELFHKMFRQVDVTNEPGMDMVIWHLLHDAKLFWAVIKVDE